MRGGRWSEERRATREAVTWLHLLLQERGPMSPPAIIEALQDAGREVRVHELRARADRCVPDGCRCKRLQEAIAAGLLLWQARQSR